MAAAVEITGLRKVYGSKRPVAAVDGLDLSVPEGGVFGFLGPNGAGKTTTIRAMVGHLRASSGSIQLLGVDVDKALPTIIDQIGAFVEAPSFFPGFSARRNLELLASSRGFARADVRRALDTVGLEERANDRVSGYSLGMRQRLGIAAVLLKNPRLLILDEPANGLDPAGILEMRNLLRRLGAEGRTIFVSSHLLSEVQQTCDRVAVVVRGRCVANGTVEELLRGEVTRHRIRIPDDGDGSAQERAVSTLRAHGLEVERDGHGGLLVAVSPSRAQDVTRVLAEEHIYLAELTPIERSLEEVFFELTGEPGAA
ncbi:MAG: ABC transporter ATP-binding protein [Acidimicrobiia bacterium]|nr:ABC transporter ATP-binding protein [Acidimicrobiia bacterium]